MLGNDASFLAVKNLVMFVGAQVAPHRQVITTTLEKRPELAPGVVNGAVPVGKPGAGPLV